MGYYALKDMGLREIYNKHGMEGLFKAELYAEESIFDIDPYEAYDYFFSGEDPEDADYLRMEAMSGGWMTDEDESDDDADADDGHVSDTGSVASVGDLEDFSAVVDPVEAVEKKVVAADPVMPTMMGYNYDGPVRKPADVWATLKPEVAGAADDSDAPEEKSSHLDADAPDGAGKKSKKSKKKQKAEESANAEPAPKKKKKSAKAKADAQD